jgi:hypothetical protein
MDARLTGDLLVAAFFSASKPKARETERLAKGALLKRALEKITDLDADDEIQGIARALRAQGVTPFHWQIEFPEVFRLGGFDVIVGNPPFAGKNTIAEGHATGYLDWLKLIHEESHGNSDLAAHFFRSAFTLLKPGGCFGLIATNTIGQGDTRSTGLRWICGNGGVIYRARKRYKWPGQAAVVVSVVHVNKGEIEGPYFLDGRPVDRITAYLLHEGGSENPEKLVANEDKSFQGSIVLGMGFTFDDTDTKGIASPLAEMHRLIRKNPRNADRIFPYIGGEEVSDSPTHAHHRYVINFEDFPLRRKETGHSWNGLTEETQRAQLREGIVAPDYPGKVAADWPDLLEIVEQKIKGHRASHSTAPWWQFERPRVELHAASSHVRRVLAQNCGATPHLAPVFIPSAVVAANTLVLFVHDDLSSFSVLQSRVHEVWARRESSSMKDDLRYTNSRAYDTFPFPPNGEGLEQIAKSYYDFRASLMVRCNEGLTKTYNRFHDPSDMTDDIIELRRLHEAMDRGVLDSYGWSNVRPVCDFFAEFDEDEDDEESSRKKKHYRYRWPDEIRDDVLARLLALNQQRYEEEVVAGLHDKADGSRGSSGRKAATSDDESDEDQGELDL